MSLDTDEARVRALAALPLFADVPEDDLRELIGVGEWRRVTVGDVLFEQGSVSDEVVVVVRGRFLVSVGEGSEAWTIAEAAEGELLGEAALFRREVKRSAQVMAAETSDVVVVRTLPLAQLGAKGNAVSAAVEAATLRTLARRIRASNHLIEERLLGRSRDEGLLGRLRGVLGR